MTDLVNAAYHEVGGSVANRHDPWRAREGALFFDSNGSTRCLTDMTYLLIYFTNISQAGYKYYRTVALCRICTTKYTHFDD